MHFNNRIWSFLLVLIAICAKGGTYTVSSTGSFGVGTFPAAIAWVNSNAASAPHTINFTVPAGSVLPSITGTNLTCSNVTIDGTSMSGYSCGNPLVTLSCNTFNGWQWTGSNITMKGVRIFGGINITGGTGTDSIYSCVFNIDYTTGATLATTAKAAFRINATNTVINCVFGGLTGCMKNIVAGVGANAVVLDGNGDGHQILGNYLGTDATGLAGLGTSFTTRVIDLESGNNIVIDGNTMGNVTGTSAGMGIYINAGTGHVIRNNNIGANANRVFVSSLAFGTSANGNNAVSFNNGKGNNSTMTNNVVGNTLKTNTTATNGNIVTIDGVTNVSLVNNYFGCDVNFTNAGSTFAGVFYTGGATGGTISGNYIGFNGFTSGILSHGLAFGGTGSVSGTFNITNNYIGVTPTGVDIGNADAGIEINSPNAGTVFNITGNYIGFNKCLRTTLGASATESAGLRIVAGTTVTISNNYIGTLPGGRTNCGNAWLGIGIEKATSGSITISNNVIAYNSRNAIQTYSAGSDKVLISQNCIFCNTNEGIELSNGSLGTTAGTGNSSFGRSFTPTYDGVLKNTVQISTAGTWKSDFTGNPWVIRGFAPAGSTVEIFQVHHCSSDATNQTTTVSKANGVQGIDYIGSVVTAANGTFSYNVTANTVKNGFTATASDLTNKRTSEFAPTVTVTPTCLPPTSITSAVTSGTPTCGTNITLSGTSNLVRASCYNNMYYSWLKNGTVVSGPTLVTSPLSLSLTSFDYLKTNVQSTDDGTYTLRLEDGNAGSASCYLQSSGNSVTVSCALPIKLIDFSGEPQPEQNVINWTLNADQHGYVEVERSTDSKNFSLLQSRYFTTGIKVENIIDLTSEPLVYYRLKIVPDGEKEFYSNVIAVNKTSNFQVSITQNRPEEFLSFDIIASNGEEIDYSIFDVTGALVNQGSIITKSGTTQHSLFIGNLPSAVYLIKFEEQRTGKTENKKFLR